MNRILGRYIGEEKGPLFIVLGAMHGNELAGVKAVQQVLKMLELEADQNPDFIFSGQFIGLCGNVQAVVAGQRFLEKDLNRQWTVSHVDYVKAQPKNALRAEDKELRELLDTILSEVQRYQPEQLIILDLHTTSADGGIFSIVTDELSSLQIAVQLHAPVITGMLQGLRGTTLHYFTNHLFNIPTTGLAFESGQHDDPDSVSRAISAIINCMRSIGCVHAFVVEDRHDEILIEYSRPLPKVTELRYVHRISEKDEFQMQPGYVNFQKVTAGELLAHDKTGAIRAPFDSFVLMPLYQSQGENGFFLVEEIYQGAY
ncbi:MAG: succinylglutamate desuccinylase/aspartoacylase family protein [Bacteroidota bacterium]